MNIKNIICIALVAGALTSCEKFLDITPTGMVIAKTGEEYRNLLTSEYNSFPNDRYKTTIRTDELVLTNRTSSTDLDAYLDQWRWKDESPSTTTTTFEWRLYYHAIYISNYIILHQGEIESISDADRSQLVGEAYMMRAYCHFILVNLYAEPYGKCDPATTRGVPLMLEADVNAVPRSSSVKAVYDQIVADVKQAESLMNKVEWGTGYNYRFNKVAAKALLARTYLYMEQWQNALDAAKDVMSAHGTLEDLNLLGSKLPDDKDSQEIIVALERFSTNMSSVIENPSDEIIAKYKDGDQRKSKYFKRASSITYTLLKTGGICSFRSGEAYLIAAEASAQLGNTAEAVGYLKSLYAKRLNATARADAEAAIGTMGKAALLLEIYEERARELAFEGHRWFDLRRTTQEALKHIYNGETYTLTKEKYTLRFPTEAVEANPNIVVW